MRKFYKLVDKRSREAMIEFLANHPRYHTLNSWNRSTSYACDLKVHHLGLDSKIVDKLYDLIKTDGFYDLLNSFIHEFGRAHNFKWQAGFNGRNGGYLVLYQGERKPSGYKSYCTGCGQKNYKSVTESGTICGRCGKPKRMDFWQTHMNTTIFPGRSTDQHSDFSSWDTHSLRRRVELVQEFDKLADAIVAEAVFVAENFRVEEEIIYVPQTRFVIKGA